MSEETRSDVASEFLRDGWHDVSDLLPDADVEVLVAYMGKYGWVVEGARRKAGRIGDKGLVAWYAMRSHPDVSISENVERWRPMPAGSWGKKQFSSRTDALNARTADRSARGVEGTSAA